MLVLVRPNRGWVLKEWKAVGCGFAFVPAQHLRLLVWGILYETDEPPFGPLVDVQSETGETITAIYHD